ncbi:hypothetical protein AKO1_004310 [Acrasis kona]|uniref:Set2 Rpb1 interacting domain-containing protein n=1 Tax=Acrasis kona TaxID=1008807 RepID=A0AAW2Z8F8_9EUKA
MCLNPKTKPFFEPDMVPVQLDAFANEIQSKKRKLDELDQTHVTATLDEDDDDNTSGVIKIKKKQQPSVITPDDIKIKTAMDHNASAGYHNTSNYVIDFKKSPPNRISNQQQSSPHGYAPHRSLHRIPPPTQRIQNLPMPPQIPSFYNDQQQHHRQPIQNIYLSNEGNHHHHHNTQSPYTYNNYSPMMMMTTTTTTMYNNNQINPYSQAPMPSPNYPTPSTQYFLNRYAPQDKKQDYAYTLPPNATTYPTQYQIPHVMNYRNHPPHPPSKNTQLLQQRPLMKKPLLPPHKPQFAPRETISLLTPSPQRTSPEHDTNDYFNQDVMDDEDVVEIYPVSPNMSASGGSPSTSVATDGTAEEVQSEVTNPSRGVAKKEIANIVCKQLTAYLSRKDIVDVDSYKYMAKKITKILLEKEGRRCHYNYVIDEGVKKKCKIFVKEHMKTVKKPFKCKK